MRKRILLTFDLEEFDIPHEFGCPVTDEEQINITDTGLLQVTGLLAKYSIPATFFTTSYYAARNRESINSLSAGHEIASHSKNHSRFSETDPEDSRTELERITGKQIYGFRMPRFTRTDLSTIKGAGYLYDSSINPTWIPGRYNNLFSPRLTYHDKRSNLIEIPISVTPFIRIPLFWLSFKNIPFPVYLSLCRWTLSSDPYLHLCFHPWEFADLRSFKLPAYIKEPSGEQLLNKLENLIVELQGSGDFSTISDFLNIEASRH